MTIRIENGMQKDFKGGWSLIPFVESPHFWKRAGAEGVVVVWASTCGAAIGVTDPHEGIEALVVGGFPPCERCVALAGAPE